MSAKPYTQAEWSDPAFVKERAEASKVPTLMFARAWATVDALQARLTSAESRAAAGDALLGRWLNDDAGASLGVFRALAADTVAHLAAQQGASDAVQG